MMKFAALAVFFGTLLLAGCRDEPLQQLGDKTLFSSDELVSYLSELRDEGDYMLMDKRGQTLKESFLSGEFYPHHHPLIRVVSKSSKYCVACLIWSDESNSYHLVHSLDWGNALSPERMQQKLLARQAEGCERPLPIYIADSAQLEFTPPLEQVAKQRPDYIMISTYASSGSTLYFHERFFELRTVYQYHPEDGTYKLIQNNPFFRDSLKWRVPDCPYQERELVQLASISQMRDILASCAAYYKAHYFNSDAEEIILDSAFERKCPAFILLLDNGCWNAADPRIVQAAVLLPMPSVLYAFHPEHQCYKRVSELEQIPYKIREYMKAQARDFAVWQ